MDLNPAFDYGSRDFSNIQRDLLRRARVAAPLWTDRDPSDFGMLLVDLWSYMGDIIHYYIDRASREAFIQTATQRESVLAFANLYDYTPNFRTSAQATVYVANTGSASVTIPANTRFKVLYNDKSYAFHTVANVIANAESTVALTVLEGTRVTEDVLTGSSTGLPNQKYLIRASGVVPSTVQTFVYLEEEKTEWIKYQSVGLIPAGVTGFVLNTTPEEGLEIVFGDRASGRIPPSGSLITTSYTISSGEEGNLPSNQFIVFESSPSPSLIIQGITAAVGGSDGQSVESIRTALQSVIKTQDRAVTLQDYRDLALTVNGVYDAVVSYEPGSAAASAGGASVTAYPLPFVSGYLDLDEFSIEVPAEVQEEVLTLLTSKSTLGVTIDVVDSITVNKLNITLDVLVNPKYVTRWVTADIETALNSLLDFENIDFGKEIKASEIYKIVMAIDGVEEADLTVLEMRNASNTLIPAGSLSPVELIRKGTFTLNVTGGINTSI